MCIIGGARPVCVLAASDAAVYGVTLLRHELFVVRWKHADNVEVYDATDQDFRRLRHMSIVHAPGHGAGRLRSLLSWVSYLPSVAVA